MNSLGKAKTQRVFVAEFPDGGGGAIPVGGAVAFLFKKSLRIYSIAVSSRYRRKGVGDALMQHLVESAVKSGVERLTLEVDADNPRLIAWYRKFGFESGEFLKDYYAEGESAYRMIRKIADAGQSGERLILVVDDDGKGLKAITELAVVSACEYLSDPSYSWCNRYQVLNFCNSYKTHSMGYYVSLLASARNHRITPSVMTVKDITNHHIAQSLLDEIKDFIDNKLKTVKGNVFGVTVILGRTQDPQFADLGRKLYSLFELPFFTIFLEANGSWKVKKISVLDLQEVMALWPNILRDALASVQEKKRHRRQRLRNYKYDLAILIDENEPTPPSCPLALKKFRKAAEEVGFFVEFITKADKRRICEFDALFIRETTGLDNHTYPLARHAYTEGLVVIDDPWSILLCSNKVWLHERLANAGVPQPQGWLLTKRNCTPAFLESLSYPLVLKLPESSFSLGVFRVDNPQELEARAKLMFAKSDLIIAQEFMQSDYDWRIGMLDNRPLYACKYYMANGHWQVYNWQSKESPTEFSGRAEAVPINQVPSQVLKAAVKASSLIGNGLYGVDLKAFGNKACVIEVNDNPSIDDGVEDVLLGNELYMRIMHSIFNRIESERQQTRYLN